MKRFLSILAFVGILLSPSLACAQATQGGVISRGGPGQGRNVLPGTPNTPAPLDLATGVPTTTTLGCQAANAATFDMWFGTTNPPTNHVVTTAPCSYLASGLANLTTYYFRARAHNAFGDSPDSAVWSFTTAPAVAGGCTDTTPSPTGRTPSLLWTPCIQTSLNQAWADYQAWVAGGSVGLPNSVGGRAVAQSVYAITLNPGTHVDGAYLYQATGNTAYAADTYIAMNSYLDGLDFGDDNNYREVLTRWGPVADWIRPAITPTQWNTLYGKLKTLAENMATAPSGDCGNVPGQGTTNGGYPANPCVARYNDTDQVVGYYFSAWTMHQLGGGVDVELEEIWNRARVGGFDSTTCTIPTAASTLRNALCYYLTTQAAGGEWIESSEYNGGTMEIFLTGYLDMKNTLGVDHFSTDGLPFIQQLALRNQYVISTDRRQQYRYSDDDGGRAFRVGYSYTVQIATAIGALAGTGNGVYAQDTLQDLGDQYGYLPPALNNNAVIGPYAMMMGYSSTTARGDASTLPECHDFAGQGQLACHNDFSDGTSSMVFMEVNNQQVIVDHQRTNFCDFQIYSKNAWQLTHPITYGGPSVFGHGVNCLSMFNGLWNRPAEYSKLLHKQIGTHWAYVAGTQGGSIYGNGNGIPPTTVHENSVEQVWLGSTDKKSDTIVQIFRFYQKQPQNQCNLYNGAQCFTNYFNATEQTAITTSAIRDVAMHTPVSPTCVSNECTWTTAGGQTGAYTTVFPTAFTRTTAAEDVNLHYYQTFGLGATALLDYFNCTACPEEAKFQIRVKETTPADFAVFISCAQWYTGITRSCTAVQSADGNTKGVLVVRQGQNDALILANARRGKLLNQLTANGSYASSNATYLDCVRLARVGYTVPWTATTATTDVYLTDLDPIGAWTYTLDGGGSQSLFVGATSALATTTISGVGAHTLVTAVTSASTCSGGYGAEEIGTNSEGVGNVSVGKDLSGSNSTISWSHTVAAGSNRDLVVGIYSDAAYTGGETCTYNGVSMTTVGHGTVTGRTVHAFNLVGPPTGAHTVQCTFGGIGVIDGGAVDYNGIDPATAIGTTPSQASAAIGNPQVAAVIPLRTNTWTIFINCNVVTTPSAGTGATSRISDSAGFGFYDSGGPHTNSGDTVTMGVTGASGWGYVMFALNPLP